MAGIFSGLAASLLRLSTKSDGESALPDWIVASLAFFAGVQPPQSRKPGSIDESLVWRAITMYEAASRGASRPTVPGSWQVASDGTQAVQVLPKPQGELERQALLQLERLVQSTTINHPGLAPVFRTAMSQGYPYVAARLNQQAESLLKRFDLPMDPVQALRITQQVAEALEYAHHRGLIHGTLSADDILVADSGRLTVLGVGVDQLRQLLGAKGAPAPTALTSPEVRGGAPPGARADVFAVGALLFILLTGKAPAPGQAVTLSQEIPAVPPAVDAVLAKALSADPGDRYADLFEMSDALRVAIHSGRSLARRPAAPPPPAASRPARQAAKTFQAPQAISGFPEALAMPEIDLAVFDQPLEMPEIAPAASVAMPQVSSMPKVDWDTLLRPVDLSALGGLTIELPIDQGAATSPDPMLAAIQAVRTVEARPPMVGRSTAQSQPAAATKSPVAAPAAPPQARPVPVRPSRKRKHSK